MAHQEINQLKKEIQQLKDEKYNLLKLINHDVRSPFNRLFALLQLLEMESESQNQQQREYLQSMYLTILSALDMIQNLKDMRDIDANKLKLDFNEFDLNTTIQNVMRTFSKQVEIKKQDITLNLPQSGFMVVSDEYYVQRIIENILSNAIKFSGSGSKIILSTKKVGDLGSISIQDFAEGIKHEEEHLLYEKFEKLSSIASGGESSLGLGLYNAKYMVEQLQGQITLIRTKQLGSTFKIDFPIKPVS